MKYFFYHFKNLFLHAIVLHVYLPVSIVDPDCCSGPVYRKRYFN